MATNNESSHGKEMVVVAENEGFPVGLRVLAVDDDRVYLKVLEALLCYCKYQPTMVQDGTTALQILREGREQFDVVISDVYMPDMDGFTLLELIGLNMDIPIIMLSSNDDKDVVYKGIESGACDYLIKPVNLNELKNIWQHVVRRKNLKLNPRVQPPKITEVAEGGARSIEPQLMNYAGNNDIGGPSESKEKKSLLTKKKPRVAWTRELHGKFLQAVNRIGIDKAVPKRIWEMMNLRDISRESVASHLQKYRLYLKRLGKFSGKRSYPLSDTSERWSSSPSMDDLLSHKHHHEHASSSSSIDLFAEMESPSAYGDLSVVMAEKPFLLKNHHSNLRMRSFGHGGTMLKDAMRFPPSDRGAKSKANIEDDLMLWDEDDNDDDDIPSYCNGNSALILREKIFEASKGIRSCNIGRSLENMTGGVPMSVPENNFLVRSTTAMSVPMIQLPVQSHMNSQHQNVVGSCNSSWQNMVPTELSNLGHGDRACASPVASQANIPMINQLTRFVPSSNQISVLDDQMAGLVGNPAPVTDFSEEILPFDMANNAISMNMLGENFAFGGAPSINSALADTEIYNIVMPSQMLNVEGASGVQLGHNNQAMDDQLNHNNQVLMDQMNEGASGVQLGHNNQAMDDQLNHNNQVLMDQMNEGASGVQLGHNNQDMDDQLNHSNQVLMDQMNYNNQTIDDQVNHNNQVLVDQMNYNNRSLDNPLGYTNIDNAPVFRNPDDQMNYNNDFFAGTDETNMMASLDGMIANFPADDFVQGDDFMGGDWI